jgi:adenylate kinase family enzyme
MRIVVIGNGGSGKSTLAGRLGACFDLPCLDLDDCHWLTFRTRREPSQAIAMVERFAQGESWVIEGVYGWLAEVALRRAQVLFWLDLPWAECRAGLLQRGLRGGMTEGDQANLVEWASTYGAREDSLSLAGHERLYEAFAGRKVRLRSRSEVTAFAGDLRLQDSDEIPDRPR